MVAEEHCRKKKLEVPATRVSMQTGEAGEEAETNFGGSSWIGVN